MYTLCVIFLTWSDKEQFSCPNCYHSNVVIKYYQSIPHLVSFMVRIWNFSHGTLWLFITVGAQHLATSWESQLQQCACHPLLLTQSSEYQQANDLLVLTFRFKATIDVLLRPFMFTQAILEPLLGFHEHHDTHSWTGSVHTVSQRHKTSFVRPVDGRFLGSAYSTYLKVQNLLYFLYLWIESRV